MLRSDPVMERLLSQIREDDVFADIGANMGLYSIRVATHEPAPRIVYAFEPAPAPYLTLLKNIKLNGCEDTCCPMPTLIGADRGFVEFSMHSLDPSDGTGHVAVGDERPCLPTGHLWAPLSVTTKVPIVSISELVRTGVIEQPTVVKIDTEGYEAQVIKGMNHEIDRVRMLALEIHVGRLVGAPIPQSIVEGLTARGLSPVFHETKGRQEHYLFTRERL